MLRIVERRVEREDGDVLAFSPGVDEPVQPTDLRVGGRVAVVPRQEVRDRDAQTEPAPVADHRLEVAGRLLYRDALRDVVDPALDDERVRALRARRETPGDLVGALAVDPAVAEDEPGVLALCPVLPLAT